MGTRVKLVGSPRNYRSFIWLKLEKVKIFRIKANVEVIYQSSVEIAR